jgi:hypothetical protein
MAASDSSQAQYVIVDPFIGAPSPVSITYSNNAFPLGFTARGVDQGPQTSGSVYPNGLGAGEFVFCQGSNVASRGQWVHISNNSAVLLTNDNSVQWPIGVACAAISATNQGGWVQVGGICDYATFSNSSLPAISELYVAGTIGMVHSVSGAAGNRIYGALAPISYAAARSASAPNLTVVLNRPYAIARTASN